MQPLNLNSNALQVVGIHTMVTFIEYGIVVVMFMYIVYLFIFDRQVHIMNKSYTTPMAPFFNLIAKVYMLAAIALAILAFISK